MAMMLPLWAIADVSGTCGKDGNNVIWRLDETTGTLTISGNGNMYDYGNSDDFDDYYSPWKYYTINKVIIEDGVTSIGNRAFSECNGITSIIIPNSVISIGEYSFGWCRELTSISIPNSVTTIRNSAFYACSTLSDITIPNSVTSIEPYAFSSCTGLTSISIPNSVTSIGNLAFMGCSGLTSVFIPRSVTSIGGGNGENVFWDCSKLNNITVETGNPVYDSRNNCNAIIKTSSNEVITGCKSTIIPNSILSIGTAAFHGSSIKSITIPNSVTSIARNAFCACNNLSSIVIPNSVTTLSTYTFQNCSALTSVTIGSGMNSIGEQVFRGCIALKDVYCLAETVPATEEKSFKSYYTSSHELSTHSATSAGYYSDIENATLHVPATAISAYQSTSPWNGFKEIVAIEDAGPTPPTGEKCAMPIISMKDGKLIFGCETSDVEFNYEITANDSKTGKGNNLSLKPSYIVKVYASKDGYENSEVATQAIYLKHGDVNGDGEIDIADAVRIVNHVVGKIPALARPTKEVKDEKVPQ